MDTPDSKESREASDRRGGATPPIEEAKSLTTTINLKSTNGSTIESKKAKSCSSKKTKKINVKKSKEIVTSSSDDSESSDASSSDSSDTSDSSSDSEDEGKKKKARSKYLPKRKLVGKKKGKKKKVENEGNSETESKPSLSDLQKEFLRIQIQTQKQRLQRSQLLALEQNGYSYDEDTNALQLATILSKPAVAKKVEKKEEKKKFSFGSKLEFKRVDHWFDKETHRYRTTDSNENNDLYKYDYYVFTVRKEFDFEGRFMDTLVDVKSKYLKEILKKIMVDDKSTSFNQKSPTVDPKKLFLYLEDIRKNYQELKESKKEEKKKSKKSKKALNIITDKIKHLKILINFMDNDYARIKKTLYPMLESGFIIYDLLWGLFKPGNIVCTPTHGNRSYLRAFKVEYSEKVACLKLGHFYRVRGNYLEYDGKMWGNGTIEAKVLVFKGARKITSLDCYPLQYHDDAEKLRNDLIKRGKLFVSLQGVQNKAHEGMAYLQKKKDVGRINVNSRIMIDPALHRRYFPNYPISAVTLSHSTNSPNQFGYESESKENKPDDSEDNSCEDSDDEKFEESEAERLSKDRACKELFRVKDLEIIPNKAPDKDNNLHGAGETNEIPIFTDEEYMIASPVVLGFSFNDKMWLEFSVSGIKDIDWNENAFESLVVNEDTKSILKALVESQKSNSNKNIDDVIRGKGRGLVTVLHGPPGTGKTLTAEGIAELLRYPLYTVSAGDLGHDATHLERQLQTILDMAYSWGAVLLLDEADVFLEKRNIADIHRNALVSIFLRLLEYFQGILFLTTNRVETFDEAFRSRIHLALRYQELSSKARQSVFKIFLDRAAALEDVVVEPFSDKDMIELSKNNLNGRQIKNTVRTALALAIHKKETLNMSHIHKVLDMSKEFERHLNGGPGFEDAMRGYF